MNTLTESEVLNLQNKLKKLLEEQLETLNSLQKELTKEPNPDKYFNRARHELKELYNVLDEHTIYEVQVKLSGANLKHSALLFTGFKNGNYWTVFNPTYDKPYKFEEVYSIQIVKKIMKWYSGSYSNKV